MDLSKFQQIDSDAYFPEGADLSERFHGIVNQFTFVEICAINHGEEKYHVAHVRELADACYDPVDIYNCQTKADTYYRLETEAQCREFLGALIASWKFDLAV